MASFFDVLLLPTLHEAHPDSPAQVLQTSHPFSLQKDSGNSRGASPCNLVDTVDQCGSRQELQQSRDPRDHLHGRFPGRLGAVQGTRTTSRPGTQEESRLHINFLELEGVLRAMQHWAPLLKNRQVTVLSNSSTMVIYINRQGGMRSKSLCNKMWDLLHFCRLQSQLQIGHCFNS